MVPVMACALASIDNPVWVGTLCHEGSPPCPNVGHRAALHGKSKQDAEAVLEAQNLGGDQQVAALHGIQGNGRGGVHRLRALPAGSGDTPA